MSGGNGFEYKENIYHALGSVVASLQPCPCPISIGASSMPISELQLDIIARDSVDGAIPYGAIARELRGGLRSV